MNLMKFNEVSIQYSGFFLKNPNISNDLYQLFNAIDKVKYFTPNKLNIIINELKILKINYEKSESIINKCKEEMEKNKFDFNSSILLVGALIIFAICGFFNLEFMSIIFMVISFILAFYNFDNKYAKNINRISFFYIIMIIFLYKYNHFIIVSIWFFCLLIAIYFSFNLLKKSNKNILNIEDGEESVIARNRAILESLLIRNNDIIGDAYYFMEGLDKFTKNKDLIPIGIQTDKILPIINDMHFGNIILQIKDLIDLVNYSINKYSVFYQKNKIADSGKSMLEGKNLKVL